MEERLKEVGKRIAEIRKAKGYKQEVFAELLQCSPVTVSRWETGLRDIRISDLIKIAECLNISADYLLGIEQREDITDMFVGLNDKEKRIVINTVKVMITEIKND